MALFYIAAVYQLTLNPMMCALRLFLQCHTHTCTHTHTHSTCTMASLASCICFYLVACLLEMLLRGIWTFSHPLPAYMCGWSVCLHASARLTLSVWSLDWANTMKNDVRESRWCLRKKKKQDREGRDWREEKRSYQSFSLTADGLREAEDTKASLWWSWLTLCATATVCCAIFLDKQKSGVDQLLPRHHCCLQHVQITRNFLSI